MSRFRGDASHAVVYMLDFDLLIAHVLFFVVAIAILGAAQICGHPDGAPQGTSETDTFSRRRLVRRTMVWASGDGSAAHVIDHLVLLVDRDT